MDVRDREVTRGKYLWQRDTKGACDVVTRELWCFSNIECEKTRVANVTHGGVEKEVEECDMKE